jgi:hypothetical protein
MEFAGCRNLFFYDLRHLIAICAILRVILMKKNTQRAQNQILRNIKQNFAVKKERLLTKMSYLSPNLVLTLQMVKLYC